jgi:L-ascorbate metabolism protein UlaG (beta-lactamase superfamily)
VAFLCLLLVSCILPVRPFDEEAWRARVEATDPALLYAPHVRDGRYFNPWMPMDKGFGDLLRWRLSKRTSYSPEETHALPRQIARLDERITAATGDFIAWIGHGTFLIRTGDTYWLTDPMFSERALLPKRMTPPALSPEFLSSLPGGKKVILSHNHYDHLDKDSLRRLPDDVTYYCPLGLKALLNDLGKRKIVEMDWWETASCGPNCRVTCLPAQHWSRRSLNDTNATLWASFLLESGGRRIYFGGDSGYFIGYREIGRRFPGIDVALLPVTAYDPRWFMHYAHMDAREALDAFRELGAGSLIPTQWGAFPLGDEPLGHTPIALDRAARNAGVDPGAIWVMDIGQLLPLTPKPPTAQRP